MIKNNDWKKTDEIEINLADLLRRLFMQWKQVLLCALAFALIAGVYGYLKNKASAAVLNDVAEEVELTEEEQQSVMSAVELRAAARKAEEYLDGSLLMKTDPYHKNKVSLLYSIERAKRQNVQKITESYISYIVNGGAADALKKSDNKNWDIDQSYLSEVITAYQKTYGLPYQVVADSETDRDILTEALFYVDLTGVDAKMAEKLASDMQSVLKKHYAKVKDKAGSHKLTLLGMEKNIVFDSGLLAQQNEKNTQLATNLVNLKAMTDAFNDVQMAMYKKAAAIKDEEEIDTDSKEDLAENLKETEGAGSLGIKYIVLGLFGGIFVYCGIFACWYLFQDTVKSEEEMKDLYTFPFYGGISVKNRTGNVKRKMLKTPDAYGQTDTWLANRIRFACKKQGITKLCAAADFSFNIREKECLENIAKQLESFEIHTVIAENASEDTALWDTLMETGNVLMVCRIDTTTHRMIDDAMRFYGQNGICVIGAMSFI